MAGFGLQVGVGEHDGVKRLLFGRGVRADGDAKFLEQPSLALAGAIDAGQKLAVDGVLRLQFLVDRWFVHGRLRCCWRRDNDREGKSVRAKGLLPALWFWHRVAHAL